MASKIERISLDLESHAMACHIPKNPGNRAVWLKGSSNFILVCPSSSELDDSKCPQYLRIPANAMSAPRLPLTGVGKDDAPVKRRVYVPCPVVSPPTADPRAGPVHVLAAGLGRTLELWLGAGHDAKVCQPDRDLPFPDECFSCTKFKINVSRETSLDFYLELHA